MKFYKYILAASVLTAGGWLTSCNDDDTTDIVVVPDKFVVELNSINVPWDEVESVIDFEAPESWVASSNATWITVENIKGQAGTQRLYVTLTPNPTLLSRVGKVSLECGQEQGVITITQGGCSDPSAVAPLELTLEVPALDYNAVETTFKPYEDFITGNLGISVEEFGAGLEEGGNIEMFMVAKDGSWINCGSTAGTPCSAWLDRDLNVTTWDGSGYPGIAVAIESYGGEEPSFAVIRAPGLPENTKYNLNWGYWLKDDHSKYFIINTVVTFPAVSYTGPVVATFDYTVNLNPDAADYEPTPLEIDAQAISAALGASTLGNAVVAAYDSEGEWVPYTANNGYWLKANGSITNWGSDSAWFIEYYGNDAENVAESPEDLYTLYVGTFPGTENLNSTFPFCFWYNGQVVQLNITALLGDAQPSEPAPGPTEPEVTYNIVGTLTVPMEFTAGAIEDTAVEFDADKVASLLGLSSISDSKMIYLYSSTQATSNYTAYEEGFWFDLSGSPCSWGAGSFCFYAQWFGWDAENLAEYPEDINLLYCGGNAEYLTAGSYVFHVDFVNAENEAVRINMLVTVK